MSDSGNGGFRKFSDNLLAASAALVILMVSAIWATTWGMTNAKINEQKIIIQTLDSKQEEVTRKLIVVETAYIEICRRLGVIDSKLDKVEDKINQILLGHK